MAELPDLDADQLQALLPWYAAGTLPAAQASEVQRALALHAAQHPALLDELAWLRRTLQQVQASTPLPPADQGLDVLLRRVRQAAVPATTPLPMPVPAPDLAPVPAPTRSAATGQAGGTGPWATVRRWLGLPAPGAPAALGGWGMAAAAVVVLVQAGLITTLLWPDERAGPGGQQPLSDPRLPALQGGVLLQITFAPTATEAQLRSALQGAQATLVAGPGAVGVYTVVVPAATWDAALARLRQQPGVVASVSLLGASAPAAPR